MAEIAFQTYFHLRPPAIVIPTNMLMLVTYAVYIASSYHIDIKNAKMFAWIF